MVDRTPVPCGTCHACCKGLVVVHKNLGDNVDDYDTVQHDVVRVLRQQDNGDCIYLSKDGCSIWDRAPAVCRDFDCRHVVHIGLPHTEEVYAAGRIRLVS